MSLVDPEAEVEVEQEATPETPVAAVVESKPDDGVPEKFRGKSLTDVLSSYQSLESELGRARNEIGTQRRLVDELLDLRRGQQVKSQPEASPVTVDELAENPEETITQVATRVAEERAVKSDERLRQLEFTLQANEFEKKHPGFQNTVKSPKFFEWVQKSPTRLSLTHRAAQGDWNSADELMNLHKEYQAIEAPATADKADPAEEAKKVALAKSGGSGANRVVNGGDGKKVWKRTDLAQLYINNQAEYDRQWPEIEKAYKEGRVK